MEAVMGKPTGFLLAAVVASAAVAAAGDQARPPAAGVTPSTLPTTASPVGSDVWPERPKDFNIEKRHNAIPPKPGQFTFKPAPDDARLVRVLVVARPFIWWVVYPGPDG